MGRALREGESAKAYGAAHENLAVRVPPAASCFPDALGDMRSGKLQNCTKVQCQKIPYGSIMIVLNERHYSHKERINMKKLLAVLMLLCLFATAALAEVTEVNWSDVEPVLEASGVEGDFWTFDEVAVKIWLPAELQPSELTEEDTANGFIAHFADAEQTAQVSVVYVDVDGMSLEDYAAYLTEEGAQDIAMEIINGLQAVEYTLPEQDSLSVAFATESGSILEITMMPLSEEGADMVWGMVGSSIQPE